MRKENIDSTMKLLEMTTNYFTQNPNNFIVLNFFQKQTKLIFVRTYSDIIHMFAFIGGLYIFLQGTVKWIFNLFYSRRMKEILIKGMYNINISTLPNYTLNTNLPQETHQQLKNIVYHKKETLYKGSQGNLRGVNLRNLDPSKINVNNSNLFLLNQNINLNQQNNLPRDVRSGEESNARNNEMIEKIFNKK